MISITKQYDVVIVGGGLAGTCAAIAAARTGAKVALVNNRPVLGGNSSSEVRVWVVGATAHGTQRFARETGIMGELFIENQFRNPDGNPYYWDQVILDLVRAETNLELFLNTDVRDLQMNGLHIHSVTGWTMGSEVETVFQADTFIDCTGDGLVGFLAGADYRMGRESRSEFGEDWAPEHTDGELLGSSMFFYTKDVGHPTKYTAPSVAIDISKTPIVANRIIRTGDNGCDYWWIEWGGETDTIHDNERIRDELWGLTYGIWDYIKNSGNFDADNLTLEWVGSIPGKRESRRFIGDHVLTQNDIIGQVDFPDAVAYGGWSIDLHPVEGVYAEKPGARQLYSPGTYPIPYRSLYSRNIDNLMFAGRLLSASHVAFGSTRVMATCAATGQAAGTAAALASMNQVTPRELGQEHLPLLLQTLARQDAPLLVSSVYDSENLAHKASVHAGATLEFLNTMDWLSNEHVRLDTDIAQVFPVDPYLDEVTFAVECSQPATVTVELWQPAKPQNFVPERKVCSVEALADPATGQLKVPLDWHPNEATNAVVVLRSNPLVAVKLANERPYGTLVLEHKRSNARAFDEKIPEEKGQILTEWDARRLRRRSLGFTVTPATQAYEAAKVVDGLVRPYGGPHLWSSPIGEFSGINLDLIWSSCQQIGHIDIVLNDDVDEDLINLHHHETPFEVIPEIITDFDVQVRQKGIWKTIAQERNNHHRVWRMDTPIIETDGIRMKILSTGGAHFASVYAINVYSRQGPQPKDSIKDDQWQPKSTKELLEQTRY